MTRYEYMKQWLPQEWVPYEVVEFLHDIRRDNDQVMGAFRLWLSRKRRPKAGLTPTTINRWLFEAFLQDCELLPLRTAACQLGMTKESFTHVLAALEEEDPLLAAACSFSSAVVPYGVVCRLHECLPKPLWVRDLPYGERCTELHKEIWEQLDIAAEPVFCVTSTYLGENPPKYAYEFCCFTGDPVGLHYNVGFSHGKPAYLRWDTCSLKFYAEHEEELRGAVIEGTLPEEMPEGLKR